MPTAEERGMAVPALILGSCVMIGLIVGGGLLGAQIKAIKLADRYVTVKGLVERTVKSDAAVWPVSFSEAGNDLPEVFAKSESDKTNVIKFLADNGVDASETSVGQINVTDTQANQYGPNRAANRYIVQQTVTVHTKDVDKLAKAAEKTADLVKAGIVLQNNGQNAITYKFNGLNSLKPDMITEATRNARASADRFAADSGSAVGSIKSANQGVFSISAADSVSVSAPGEEGGGFNNDQQADSSIMKKVRVVATVDYYLKWVVEECVS
jgi:uncharacterized protein